MRVSGAFNFVPNERVQAVASALLPLARMVELLDMNAHAVAEAYAFEVIRTLDAMEEGNGRTSD